jgi:hypothetical protein
MTISKLLRPSSIAKVKRLAGQTQAGPSEGHTSPVRSSAYGHAAQPSGASAEKLKCNTAPGGASLFLPAASQDAPRSTAPSHTQWALRMAHQQQLLKVQESLRRCEADMRSLACISQLIQQQDVQDGSTNQPTLRFDAEKQRKLDIDYGRWRQSLPTHVEDGAMSALSQQTHIVLPPITNRDSHDAASQIRQMGTAKPSALDSLLTSLLAQTPDANLSGHGIARPVAKRFQHEEGSSSVMSRA